jgi:hypothetical protein
VACKWVGLLIYQRNIVPPSSRQKVFVVWGNVLWITGFDGQPYLNHFSTLCKSHCNWIRPYMKVTSRMCLEFSRVLTKVCGSKDFFVFGLIHCLVFLSY